MTKEELSKIKFICVSHMSMEYEHTSSYMNLEYGFYACRHTRRNKFGEFGRSYTHYMYNDKVYKSLDKFLEAIKDVEFKG